MKPRSDDKYYEINIYTTGLLRTQHNMWKKPCDIQLTTLLLVTHVILHLGLEYLKLFSYYTTLKHHFLKHFRVVLETYKMFAWHEMAVSVLWCEKYLKNTSLLSCSKALMELVILLFGECSKNQSNLYFWGRIMCKCFGSIVSVLET